MSKTAAEIRREKLRNRQKAAVENRDKKGLGKKSILDWSKLSKKKPSEFVPEAKKKHVIDILPFKVTQEWYKNLRTTSGLTTGLDIDEWDYKLEIPVHKGIGENNDTFICLREAFGGKCKICDDMFEEYAKDNPDEKIIKNCKPSWRNYFNVYDYDDPDADIQIWDDASYYVFEKEFLDEAEDGEEIVLYTDIEEGKSIEFKGKEKKIGKNSFVGPKNINFVNRDPYDEDIINDTISFDALVQIPTYEDVAKAHDPDVENNDSDSDNSDSNDKEEAKEEKPNSRRGRQKKEEAEPEKVKDETVDNKCPSGLDFGYDCNPGSAECEKCSDDHFNACADKKEELELDKKMDDKIKEEEKPEKNEMQIDEEREKEEKPKSSRRRGRSSEKKETGDSVKNNLPKNTRKRTRR